MNILHIDSSPRRESHSRELSAAIVEKLLEVAGANISRRDLGTEPLPTPWPIMRSRYRRRPHWRPLRRFLWMLPKRLSGKSKRPM
ncbi:NAD(P)H-dependent oxidoreductase [Sinorhizobium psoraleae]|uniref:NAD(P)H-dependent oxidoreductase n=1 Tax=Sinorhizobium psoraleae TaxID=520838 RepID=UPI00249F17C3